MVLEKLPRNATLDGVDLYRRLDQPNRSGSLDDPLRIDAVLNEIRAGLVKDLATASTVRGWRAQALFASLVAALDACDLMTLVDAGDIYFDGESVKPADYFLHLRSGERLLVDVKSVELRNEDPLSMLVKFSESEVRRMKRFGELFGAEVYLGIYYPAMPMWSLVALRDLQTGPGGGRRISVHDSMIMNRIALLGDLHIGTKSPLELVIRPDPDAPNELDADGNARFTVGSAELCAGGRRLDSDEARRLAFFLVEHGGWEVTEQPRVQEGRLVELRYVAEPIEDTGQGFEIVGSLSAMYSRLFEASTTGSGGATALDMNVRPGMLVSLVPHDYESAELPLWRLKLQATSPVRGDDTSLAPEVDAHSDHR